MNFASKKTILFSLGFIFLIGITWLFLPSYLRNTVKFGFANIDDYKIFPNQIIHKGEEQPWPLSPNYNKKKISEYYLNWIKHYKTKAYVVIENGQLIHESYYDGYTSESISNSFSIAKSIVSLLMGVAIREGYIESVEEPVAKYFSPFKNIAENSSLKLIHLLTMSSGLNWDEKYSSPFSLTTKAYYGDNLYQLMASLRVVDTPGIKFQYLSCNTQLLSYVLESATGKSIVWYAQEKLWKPLGATHYSLWSTDRKEGDIKAFCCYFATAKDFARLGQLILNHGKWKGKTIVDSIYLTNAVQPASWLLDENSQQPLKNYGYQFWLLNFKNTRVILLQGLAGQYIMIIPQFKRIIVRLGEKRAYFKHNGIPSDVYLWLLLAHDIIHCPTNQ